MKQKSRALERSKEEERMSAFVPAVLRNVNSRQMQTGERPPFWCNTTAVPYCKGKTGKDFE